MMSRWNNVISTPIKTRKALVVLDFQNDFIRPNGALPVPKTQEMLEILPSLAAEFRKIGEVIWVQSKYDKPAAVFDPYIGDRIILDPIPQVTQRRSDVIEVGSDRDSPEPVDAEAFLSGPTASCCKEDTIGFKFPAPIQAAIQGGIDQILTKTKYSAFEETGLIGYLRSRFVTQLYICGTLANVAVFATVVDAAPSALKVTLIEDCLGFRTWRRYSEAMRLMADHYGVSGMSSDDLLQEIDWEVTDRIAANPRPAMAIQPRSSMQVDAIIQMMGAQEKEDETFAEGDSCLVKEIDIPTDAFQHIHREVSWSNMYHQSGAVPRLVAAQGLVKPDGTMPIYRHPADESPLLKEFTATVEEVRLAAEKVVGHPLNHALIQLYRDGRDCISEHSDKTLDIVRGSKICNVSLGAQRVMTLRTKRSVGADRTTIHVPLPHSSMFILGEKTNMRWLHSVRSDKRSVSEKTAAELAFGGERISLTFRQIGTYLNPRSGLIWGQGAKGKTQNSARRAIYGDRSATEQLIAAFGRENKACDFNWNEIYGGGSDVVNFSTASTAQVVLCDDSLGNLRVLLALAENGLRYEISEAHGKAHPHMPTYIDSSGTSTVGSMTILDYLARHPVETTTYVLKGAGYFALIDDLLSCWRKHLAREQSLPYDYVLRQFEKCLDKQHYLGGTAFSLDDCALWPVLREIVHFKGNFRPRFMNLDHYYHRVKNRGIVRAILRNS